MAMTIEPSEDMMLYPKKRLFLIYIQFLYPKVCLGISHMSRNDPSDKTSKPIAKLKEDEDDPLLCLCGLFED